MEDEARNERPVDVAVEEADATFAEVVGFVPERLLDRAPQDAAERVAVLAAEAEVEEEARQKVEARTSSLKEDPRAVLVTVW